MADTYAKKPKVTRFERKQSYDGRDVKRTSVVRRETPGNKGRPTRPMIPMKKGR